MMASLASSPSNDSAMPPPPQPVSAYLNLAPAQRDAQAGLPALIGVLQALATGYDPAPEQRRKLIAATLASAASLVDDPAPSPLLVPLCTTLKFVGRNPAGSEELGRQNGLRTLVKLGGLERVAELAKPSRSLSSDEDEEDDDEAKSAEKALAQAEKDPLSGAEAEALRCLCNTLTLHPSARDVFPYVLLADEKRAALKGMVRILACNGAGFLGGRLLFLVTSKASDVVGELAHAGECVETMEQFAKRYLAIYNSPTHRAVLFSGPATTTMDDILREHLKLAYNLMLQYSRQPANVPEAFLKPETAAADETGARKKRFWRSREKSGGSATSSPETNPAGEEATPNTTSTETTSPPPVPSPPSSAPRSKSPLSFAKRAVDAVKHRSNGVSSTAGSPSTDKGTPTLGGSSPYAAGSTPSQGQEGTSPDALSLTASHLFLPLFQPYLSLAVTLPLLPSPTPTSPTPSSFKDPSPVVRSALATLLNFPVELEELSGWATSWLQYVPSRLTEDGSVLRGGGIGSLGERLLELLEGVCDAYFPVDRIPENPKVLTQRDREGKGKKLVPPVAPDEWIPAGEGEANKIEEILGPVMLLLRKLSMLGEAQIHFRERLLPPNLDRSLPLERHPSLAGHLVRLLNSILLPNTAYGVGEFLYNLADRDPATLVRGIGYGNASGFLQNRGELIPPPAGEEGQPGGGQQRVINPITGAYEQPEDPDHVPMTEDEKEREAEKLYTLFDRMSRTGVMNVENPVDKARAEGRFEETSEQREAELERLKKEEDELEEEVERDMKEWKERRKRAAEQGGIDLAKVAE
ncbi:hypothetical protein JCM11251_002350 [Rhodosporidiobolus azoricus]